MVNKDHILCPSAQCEEGSILLGIVKKDGHVSFASEKIFIDKEFVQIAHLGRSPEKRFRFANVCMKNACKHWTGNQCEVIDKIMEIVLAKEEPSDLPKCSIRNECRWYKQYSGKACAVCPIVITDLHTD